MISRCINRALDDATPDSHGDARLERSSSEFKPHNDFDDCEVCDGKIGWADAAYHPK
jgi:hypothetical protein